MKKTSKNSHRRQEKIALNHSVTKTFAHHFVNTGVAVEPQDDDIFTVARKEVLLEKEGR